LKDKHPQHIATESDGQAASRNEDHITLAFKSSSASGQIDQFGSSKILGNDHVIFKIKGNKYRLIVKISFANKLVWIRFLGTHEEYDLIDAKAI